MAASIGPQRISDATTVETPAPLYRPANWIANLPGGSVAPETMAASVSRMMCRVFSATASGSVRRAASAM
jgi:hypothetical protein